MPVELENKVMTSEEVAKLWEAFQMFDEDGNSTISAEELGQVMRSLGQNPSDTELRDMIKEVDVDLSGTIDFEEFKALMVSQQGDRQSRLALAFSVFDENGSGQITADEMRAVMSQFGLTDQELDEIIKEVDHDGDASIDFEEFCKLVPEKSETAIGYTDSPIPLVTPKTTDSPVTASNDEVALHHRRHYTNSSHRNRAGDRAAKRTTSATPTKRTKARYVPLANADWFVPFDSGSSLPLLPRKFLCQSRNPPAGEKSTL